MYTVEQQSRNVSVVKVKYKGKFQQRFLLTGDRHWDNPLSDWSLQKRHLIQAKKYNAGVIDVGDLFCAMQGRFDKRSNKSALRPEHQVDDYLDALIRTASKFFGPYARQFILIAMGNHETKILKNHETNLTNSLVERLNEEQGSSIYNGGYSGWVVFEFEDERTGQKSTTRLWYIHGYGGGGPVTRGVIQSNRKAVYLPDAQIVLSGHTHDEWIVPISRARLDDQHIHYVDEQVHVQVPTYKNEYADGYGGWHIETGKPPKPIGALWLNFHKDDAGSSIQFDFLRAK